MAIATVQCSLFKVGNKFCLKCKQFRNTLDLSIECLAALIYQFPSMKYVQYTKTMIHIMTFQASLCCIVTLPFL